MPGSKIFRRITVIALSLICLEVTAAPDLQRQKELNYLLKHDCGSCHGMRLEGGLGPALKPVQLQFYSVEQVAFTILHGRPGTPMPPWQPFLSEQDANWLAARLKAGVRP